MHVKNPSSYWHIHALFIKHYNTCEQSSLERLLLFYNNQTLFKFFKQKETFVLSI